jgi:16S rRNA (cytidine1402-2'-O)-methyltransferase
MGKLFVVATPIGNLDDITFRAVQTLKEADLIACEDTRHSLKLLNHYQIKKPLVSYHQHSKIKKVDYLIKELETGKSIALITDSGTPGISDPGQVLINKAIESGIEVVPVPGPSALTAALSASGLPTDSFLFLGFLPLKKGRKRLLESLKGEKRTVVLYESPHRVIKTLDELETFLGKQVKVVIAREITKLFEEIARGTLEEVSIKLKNSTPKGEFVIVINNK